MIPVKLMIVLYINWEKINLLKVRLAERNNKISFVTFVPPKCNGKKVNTLYGMFQIGSPLSFHLNPVGFTTNIIKNIPELSMSPFTTHELPKLPPCCLNYLLQKIS